MKHLITILFLISFLSATKGQKTTVPSDSFTKIDRKYFSVSCPVLWTIDTSGKWDTDIIVLSQKDDVADRFSENLNIIIQKLPSDTMSLKTYASLSEEQIMDLLEDAEVIYSREVSELTKNYHSIAYYHTQGNFKVKSEQYYFIKNGSAYIITFSSEKEKEIKYKNIATSLLNSFTLK